MDFSQSIDLYRYQYISYPELRLIKLIKATLSIVSIFAQHITAKENTKQTTTNQYVTEQLARFRLL